jgi:hypothetical protein
LTTLDIHGNNFSIETLFNLLNITQKYAQHKNLKPCKIICDPINFSFLKNSNKDKFQNELTEENILNTNPDAFEENIKLIKNLSFSYKKSKIKNKTKNKNKN